ncbi:hypothetical protein F5876DRAFT_74158 [Lentinula aff. lateritia]|uniref:Uncharacterized protein n=1 Tax=Lentinula aff. lateritia TaxID=2804960 RepID=A0ACC1U8L4_9AGAR|nr:hypothetical protein F5876DRAFT_74158 [Lentinula aff. lateritia]
MSRNTIWIIGFLEVALVFLFVNSAVAKPLFKHTTSVLQELCSSFAAFALNSGPSLFNMADSTLSDYSVLSLLVVSLEVNDKEIARLNMGFTIYVWIRIVLAVVFTQFGYTIILVALAMLTHFSFDKNVWKRDIDSSPAPFPFAIIVSILLPCVFHRPDLTLLPFPSGPADASPVIRPPYINIINYSAELRRHYSSSPHVNSRFGNTSQQHFQDFKKKFHHDLTITSASPQCSTTEVVVSSHATHVVG